MIEDHEARAGRPLIDCAHKISHEAQRIGLALRRVARSADRVAQCGPVAGDTTGHTAPLGGLVAVGFHRAAHPSRWSLTMPVACISAYAVVGPTNLNPRRLSSLAIAVDSAVTAATCSYDVGAGAASGANDHSKSVSDSSR